MTTVQGAKGGSEKQRSPVESPDSLVSIGYARILDLISEGEIFGLVDGANSIYLNETPAGTGFANFTFDTRTGTQDQAYMAGFPQVESEVNVGIEWRAEQPYVRTVTDLNLSAVRFNLFVPALRQQNQQNGDITGYTVQYAVDLAIGSGPYQEVMSSAFSGKTNGGYERSIRIDLPGQPVGGWRIRLRRITPNATSAAIADTINIRSYTDIIDAKFRYPNSALVGVNFDAQTFGGSIPKRSYHARGRIIRVPTNYDPESRLYNGVWDGTFKLAYTNNPAWIYFDLLLHPRYGLGERINANQIDKWGLYQISQYCDEPVDDGMGGKEPRFTCNIYLQRQADALKVLQDISSVFRGITYWGAGQAQVSADMPADPVFTYTNASVLNGKFTYQGSKRRTRYSVALVTWNDPADMYRAKVEYVSDAESIANPAIGVRQVSITAFGCTSQGQAQRAGRWALLTNKLEAETVNFSVGLEGIRCRPGHIIRVADNDRAGRRIGGRLRNPDLNGFYPDRAVVGVTPNFAGSELDFAGSTLQYAGSGSGGGTVSPGDTVWVTLPDGAQESRIVESFTGDGRVTVVTPFSAVPLPSSIWAVESDELATQTFRVIAIAEEGPLQFSIQATKHVLGKHAAIDGGTIISTRPITAIPSSVQLPPTNVRATTDHVIEQYAAATVMTIAWDSAVGAVAYDVEWRRESSEWVYAGRTGATEIDVRNVYAGNYQFRVKAVNALDVMSTWALGGPTYIQGKNNEPPLPVNLRTESLVFAIRVRWGVPVGAEDTAYTELQYGTSQDPEAATTLGQIGYPTTEFTLQGLGPGARLFFRARLIDKTGNVGGWSAWFSGISETGANAILDYLVDQITSTQLSADLMAEIEAGGGSATAIEQIREEMRAAITLRAQVRDADGQLVSTGIALGIEPVDGELVSQILMLADRFAILSDVNGTIQSPFVVQDGNVYINSAFIQTATIQNALVGATLRSVAVNSLGEPLLEFNFQTGASVTRAESGLGRVEQTNQLWRVFDSNGTLRVRLGIWS